MTLRPVSPAVLALAATACASMPVPDAAEEIRALAALDTAYQAAVERNDAAAMADILHKDMILVLGTGMTYTRDDLIRSAEERHVIYEHQVEDPGTQTVRLYGRDTAIITARLWLKGTTAEGAPIERRLWFSDTYVRTPEGWKYAFGQASIALPDA
ncbi:MAG TPA: nuclear transport factor 2 family protein [Hyphomonas sp.]|nr:nuclear transport factor 2 family protein [Hyphomonas sp.]HRX73863.1 nuclear transport factor 2 family protein [Hyphomonas sp.]